MLFFVLGSPECQLMDCLYCAQRCIKSGKRKGKQKYRCRCCGKYQQASYRYQACKKDTDRWIIDLNRESCGISSISRLLRISKTTVIKRIKELSRRVPKPLIFKGKAYEVDELKTYIGNKKNECWVCLAVEKQTGKAVDLAVGRRTKKTLGKVIDTLKLSEAKKVYTDGLDIYRSLIPTEIHKATKYGINKVERKNLDLRNSLKRLARRTICYSKSKVILEASVRLCLWG